MAALPIIPTILTRSGSVFTFPTEEAAAEFQSTSPEATVRLEPAAPAAARPLYDIEAHLAALIDTEDSVPPELEEEYRQEFQRVLLEAEDKRDAVGWFLGHCHAQAEFAHAEVKRLQARENFFTAIGVKLEGYLIGIIVGIGRDAKGKWKKLEGRTSTFSLRRNPPSVDITDEAAIPAACKHVTVKLPAPLWDTILDSLDMDVMAAVTEAMKTPQYETSKTLVQEAIKAAVPAWKELLAEGVDAAPRITADEIPGAALVQKARLVRE